MKAPASFSGTRPNSEAHTEEQILRGLRIDAIGYCWSSSSRF